MKKSIVAGYFMAIVALALVISCAKHAEPINSQGAISTLPHGPVHKTQIVIAKEIVSIIYAFGEALVGLENSNASSFMLEVDSLTSRLDVISQELDTLGPFQPALSEATRKQIDDKGKVIAQLRRERPRGPLQSEDPAKTEGAVNRFFQAWASVCAKAGLDEVAH